VTATQESTTRPVGRGGWRRPTGRALFFGVLLVVLAVYTEMAFEMEWRTAAGRIGPGFFPRFIGIFALLITVWALVKSLRAGSVDDEDEVGGEEEAGEADLGKHPVPLLLVVGAAALLIMFFNPLGMIVSCAIFLAGTLFLLNRGKTVANIVISLGLPVLVYLLFQTLLNAGLPDGILPRF
jgi:putative tricarboxylic transport membrane protein